MKDNPLIIGLLIALIVVLVIAGVSLLVKTNDLSNMYKKEVADKISFEKNLEDLKVENIELRKNIEILNVDIKQLKVDSIKQIEVIKEGNSKEVTALKEEYIKLEILKEKLEDNLKDELMKKRLESPVQ